MADNHDFTDLGGKIDLKDLEFLLIALFWTLMIGVMASWHYYDDRQAALEIARTAARQSFAKDLIIRSWASGPGGVYVPVSESTPPNPYLSHLAERDITTPSGRPLTLLNPAYITRQLYELAQTSSLEGTSHLTSLRPLRPENAPDHWEETALKSFAAGAKEWSSLERIDGQSYLRLMRPMQVEPTCLKCHTDQPVGAVRGGISVTVPWSPFLEALHQSGPSHLLGFGSIWLLGLLGLWFSRQSLHRHLDQRRLIEQGLRQSEEKYRLLTEGTEAILWEFDLTADRWTYVAPQVTRLLGYEPREWHDLQFWIDHIHPDDRNQTAEYCRKHTELGEDHKFEYRFLKKEGGIAWLRNVVTVESKDNRPVRLRGVMIDLSEHRELEEKLRQSAKMEAVGTLAAGVAHDFNNILTSLISFTTLVQRRHQDDPTTQDYLKEMLDGSRRAAELTRSLLAYSRKLEIRIKREDLNDIIDRNRKMLRRIVREDIEIRTDLITGELPVLADRTQIEQVLMNLAGNAQDAMPEGGTLTVSTSRIVTMGPDNLAVSRPNFPVPCAVMTVADTGAGIGPELLERIFDPFFTTKAAGRGTGLGLAQAQGIVQQHQGIISVESEPGAGSVFSIFLPLQSPPEIVAAEPQEEPAGPSTTRTVTILLVEDEPQVRKVLRRLFTNQGHRVREAADGNEAVRLFGQDPDRIDLVVMDVIMPGLSGREAYEEMRRIKPEIKVLFVTGYPGDIITVRNIREEKLHLLAKPLDPDILLREIEKIINE